MSTIIVILVIIIIIMKTFTESSGFTNTHQAHCSYTVTRQSILHVQNASFTCEGQQHTVLTLDRHTSVRRLLQVTAHIAEACRCPWNIQPTADDDAV